MTPNREGEADCAAFAADIRAAMGDGRHIAFGATVKFFNDGERQWGVPHGEGVVATQPGPKC